MMSAMASGRTVLGSCVALVAALGVSAQSTTKHIDPASGYELRVPRWLEPFPTKPGDTQTLLQLKGAYRTRDKRFDGDVELSVLLVRILKQGGPTTGEEEKEKEKEGEEELDSLTKQRRRELNAGTTLPEYLARRSYKNDLKLDEDYFRKPLTDDKDRQFQVHELVQGSRDGEPWVLIRAFVVEDDSEIFGIVALGAGVMAFERDIERIVRSLKPADPDDVEEVDDVYAGSELRDIEKRRQVRAELVEGWEAYDTENFILVTNVTKKKVVENMLTDLEILRAGFTERFPPAEGADMSPVSTVRLCDGYDDYLRYAGQRMDGTGGYWAFTEEELVLFNPERRIPKLRPWLKDLDPISVLYHEAMHQYFHYSNRQLAPGSWFNEGYGEVFGGADVDRRKGAIKDFKANKFRMKLIRAERKRAGSPDLRMMLIMPQREFYGPGVLVNYANAWSFCYFIEKERQKSDRDRNQAWADFADVYIENLREITERYRKKFPSDAPDDWIMTYADEIQREAIDETLKTVDPEEMEDAWQKAVMKWR